MLILYFQKPKYVLVHSATDAETYVFSHLQTIEKLSQTLDALSHLQKTVLLQGNINLSKCFITKHCSTTAVEPLTVSLWCLLFSARQQSSTTRCPAPEARCLIQERWSLY